MGHNIKSIFPGHRETSGLEYDKETDENSLNTDVVASDFDTASIEALKERALLLGLNPEEAQLHAELTAAKIYGKISIGEQNKLDRLQKKIDKLQEGKSLI